PEIPGKRIEAHPEAIAHAVSVNLLDVGSRLAKQRRGDVVKRIVRGRRPIIIQTQNNSRQMSVVRVRSTEIVVRHGWAGTGSGGSAGKILQKATTAIVSHQNVEFAIRPEAQNAAVMISA